MICKSKKKQFLITYSGPAYVGIRSAKHTGSNVRYEEFQGSLQDAEGKGKPIMMVTVDENPRYKKTIECAIDYFTSFDLDALLIATNAPGRSSFNRGERRMAWGHYGPSQ